MKTLLSTFSAPASLSVCKFSFILSTQNKLFGNENKAIDHAQQFIENEKQNYCKQFMWKLQIEAALQNSAISNGILTSNLPHSKP